MPTTRVIYHWEDGSWWAESPEVPGWSVAGETFDEVRRLAIEGIPWTTGQSGAELRHIVSPALLPFFNGGTAGAIAHVTISHPAKLDVTTTAPLAGVPSPHDVHAA